MNKRILLYIALMFVGLYAIPNTVALLQGMHSYIEGSDILCSTCHGNVAAEVSTSAIYKHTLAANNSNYTTYLAIGGVEYYANNNTIRDSYNSLWTYGSGTWTNGTASKIVRLDKNDNGIIDGDEVCGLCHNITLAGENAHAAIVITCDDDRCHGNKNYNYNSPALFFNGTKKITAVGYNLSTGEIHRKFYIASSNESTHFAAGAPFGYTQGNADPGGTLISQGFYSCVTCHTDVGQGAALPAKELFNHSNPDQPKGRY